jgi:hypothetical protein
LQGAVLSFVMDAMLSFAMWVQMKKQALYDVMKYSQSYDFRSVINFDEWSIDSI